ncbi:MAG: ATP-dependent Clp protease adapter ClpS [Actinomycetota bacterium]|jgi:ATP-dependent Clp protease adaptor protein ClpS|nr:ATP-dependent Clp protease adapter ClpS [Rubrobacter sp.]MDQ3508444.1 ATP-dependent Clp protease adapter ClpS [Actinomycetota bacterium]
MEGFTLASPKTPAAPKETTRSRTTQEPPYKVLLHNDDFTPMEHVVEVLRKVIPRMSAKQAVDIMMEAHKNGYAVVIKCHKELAEMYQESLNNEGLISTIEPD